MKLSNAVISLPVSGHLITTKNDLTDQPFVQFQGVPTIHRVHCRYSLSISFLAAASTGYASCDCSLVSPRVGCVLQYPQFL